MASLNKVQLIGNLGKDPETRYMSNGEAVTNISVATTESWMDKASGEKKELTEWHRITFYRKLAEIAGQYLKKGSQVYVEGRLQTRKWTDKEGVERYVTEVIADNMKMLCGGPKQVEGYSEAASPKAAAKAKSNAPDGFSTPESSDDSDVPF